MYKYEIGETVYKPKGYAFIGTVVGRYTVDGGNRYDVQVDGKQAIARLHELMRKDLIKIPRVHTLMELEGLLMNCHGMIHIFSEEQLARYDK